MCFHLCTVTRDSCSLAIGEVWCNTLHNVYAALIAAHGFSATAKTDPDGTEGNVVFLHLFIDALAIQLNKFLPKITIN